MTDEIKWDCTKHNASGNHEMGCPVCKEEFNSECSKILGSIDRPTEAGQLLAKIHGIPVVVNPYVKEPILFVPKGFIIENLIHNPFDNLNA